MELILILIGLAAVVGFVPALRERIGEYVATHWFIPLYRRYALDGGVLTGSGEIIRKDGTRLPFSFRNPVTLAGAAIDLAMRRVTPSKSVWGRMRGAVTHPTSVRNTLADTVVDLVDAGVGSNGTIQFQTAGDVEVATLSYQNPAYANASVGQASANAITSDTNATGNASPVAKSRHYDTDNNEVFQTNVQTTGGDINLSSLIIGSGDTVSMNSMSYAAPL